MTEMHTMHRHSCKTPLYLTCILGHCVCLHQAVCRQRHPGAPLPAPAVLHRVRTRAEHRVSATTNIFSTSKNIYIIGNKYLHHR